MRELTLKKAGYKVRAVWKVWKSIEFDFQVLIRMGGKKIRGYGKIFVFADHFPFSVFYKIKIE